HKQMRIRYTTYDVRRGEDVIHVDTPQCNVMLLDKRYDIRDKESWAFSHANVSYLGVLPNGKVDHRRHRVDIGWIHWYDAVAVGEEFKLDRVSFSPLKFRDSLGFVDPS
ncbi:hypothetical protein FA13DRAFT_1575352, partial [Coprinellus micaceus]